MSNTLRLRVICLKVQNNNLKTRIITMYFFIGVIFGMMFPIGAFVFEIYMDKLSFSIESIKSIHSNNKLLFMIDSAPIFLGIFALIGGVSKVKSEIANEKNSKILSRIKETSSSLYDNLDQISSSTHQIEDRENGIREIAYSI